MVWSSSRSSSWCIMSLCTHAVIVTSGVCCLIVGGTRP